jgi:hypothetical protein
VAPSQRSRRNPGAWVLSRPERRAPSSLRPVAIHYPVNQPTQLDLDLDPFPTQTTLALHKPTHFTTAQQITSRAQTPKCKQSTRLDSTRLEALLKPHLLESRPLSSGLSHSVSSWPANGLIIAPFPDHSCFLLELFYNALLLISTRR